MEEKEVFRKLFPVCERYIYLDHAGVAPVSIRVRDEISDAVKRIAEEGAFAYEEWTKRIEETRTRCARLVNGKREEIAFVRSTSHGLSIIARGLKWKEGDNVVFCEKDFPSNVFPWEHLQERNVEIRRVPNREGRIEIEDFKKRMDGRTRLVAASTVQFVSGFRINLKKLGALCRQVGALFCVDAIQSLGLLEMDVKENGVDFLSADAHKWILGPEGIGIFYCKNGLAEELDPPLIGWKSVQRPFSFEKAKLQLRKDALRFEEGSMNLVGIIGLGAAVKLLMEIGIDNVRKQVMELGELIIKKAEERGFHVMTPRKKEERGGAITFGGTFDPERMRGKLREKKIMVNVRGNGLRVSPHVYNTAEDIETFFKSIDEVIGRDAWRKQGKEETQR